MNNHRDHKKHFDFSSIGLSPQEIDVLALYVNDYTRKEIEEVLQISEKATAVHLSNIYRKVDIRTVEDIRNTLTQGEIVKVCPPMDDLAEIMLPPGTHMCRFVERWFSPEKYEKVCKSVIADWHSEYFEALDQKRGPFKMAAIRIRYTYAFINMLGLLSFFQTVGKIAKKLGGIVGN